MSRLIPMVALLGCNSDYTIQAQPVDIHPEQVTECAFQDVDGMAGMQEYTCNPVFTASGEEWAKNLASTTFNHTMVMGHPFYQLWYVGYRNNGDWSVGYAASPNGTDWTPHAQNPGWAASDPAAWDGDWMQNMKVSGDPNTGGYLMLYGGISRQDQFGIGVAASRDGREWERMPGNPVLDMSLRYSGVRFSWPLDLTVREGSYEAWLAGERNDGPLDIYRMVADRPDQWTDAPERILGAGSGGDWDDEGFLDAAYVELDGVGYLFYVGFGAWVEDPDTTVRYASESYVGLAVRTDTGWSRVRKNPIPIHLVEDGQVDSVAARAVGNRIHLWVGQYHPDLDMNGIGLFVYEPPVEAL